MPNPSDNGVITISANQKTKTDTYFEVFDYTGKRVAKDFIQIPKTFINVERFGLGVYLVQIHSGAKPLSYKFIYN